MTFRVLNIMLFVISLEGRDDGGKTVENRAFYFSDNFPVFCPPFFKDFFSEESIV